MELWRHYYDPTVRNPIRPACSVELTNNKTNTLPSINDFIYRGKQVKTIIISYDANYKKNTEINRRFGWKYSAQHYRNESDI